MLSSTKILGHVLNSYPKLTKTMIKTQIHVPKEARETFGHTRSSKSGAPTHLRSAMQGDALRLDTQSFEFSSLIKRASFALFALIVIHPTNILDAAEIVIPLVNNSAGIADANLINSTIASSKPGDEIVFDGVYVVNQTIKLLGQRAYRGRSSKGTTVRQASNANLLAVLASSDWVDNGTFCGLPITLKDITIDGNSQNNLSSQTTGLIIMNWNSTIRCVSVANARGSGIRLTSKNRIGTQISNSMVNGQITDCFIESSGLNGIEVIDSGNSITDWDLIDNWVASSGKNGVYMENTAGWKIIGNHIYGVGENAIVASRMFGSTIADNYIEGFGEASPTTPAYGIKATIQGDAASVIRDNKVFCFAGENSAPAYTYIGIDQVNYGAGALVVSGNAIRGGGTAKGIGLRLIPGNNKTLNVVKSGNLLFNVAVKTVDGAGVINQ